MSSGSSKKIWIIYQFAKMLFLQEQNPFFKLYCFSPEHQNERKKDKKREKLASTQVSTRHLSVFRICQFLSMLYLGL